MSVTVRTHLPDGYLIEDLGRVLRLHGPDGTLLGEERRSRAAAARLEERAWTDVWASIEREIHQEVSAFREGARPLQELKRLRQYLRMVDAVERSPAAIRERAEEQIRHQVSRTRFASGLALAASAAALAITLLMTQPWLAWGPRESSDGGLPSKSGPTVATRPPERTVRPAATGRSVRAPGVGPMAPAGGDPRSRRARPVMVRRPAKATHVVAFGDFASRTAADIRMRVIRSKGYVVYVTRIRDSYQVSTAPRPQAHAERLAEALQEIGLPAQTRIVRL
jgi:hypothetical protein